MQYEIEMPTQTTTAPTATNIVVHLCIPDDQKKFLPKRRRAPAQLPRTAPVPRQGEVIYLSPTSAWGVAMVVHEWKATDELHVQVWLTYVNSSLKHRPSGFTLQ